MLSSSHASTVLGRHALQQSTTESKNRTALGLSSSITNTLPWDASQLCPRLLSAQRRDASCRPPLQLPSCKRHHQRQPPPPPSRILTHLMGGAGEASTLQHFRSAMGTASFRSRAQHSPVTVPATPRKREREGEVTTPPPFSVSIKSGANRQCPTSMPYMGRGRDLRGHGHLRAAKMKRPR